MAKPKILLSFDLEEFDLPLEFGQSLPESDQYSITLQGLHRLESILDPRGISATFFVTASFAQRYPDEIRKLSERHEIASHGMFHSDYRDEHLSESRKILRELTGQTIEGFRMPRLQSVNMAALEQAGYLYNSSLNPTYLPGRYNNLTRKRTYHDDGTILNIPTAVTPLVRFPIFWLTLKVFPLSVTQLATSLNLRWDRYLCTYCHPWEFADISSIPIPGYIRTPSGVAMKHKFTRYLDWLETRGSFITCGQFTNLIRTGNLT